MQLPVVSFNLRCKNNHDTDNHWDNRKDAAAQAVRTLAPAVMGTQEGYHSMLLDLSERIPEYQWIGCGREGGVEGEFMAVFYRPELLQPISAGHFWLSDTPAVAGSRYPGAGCTRMCTWVQFRVRENNQEFLFCNTHLDHMSSDARVFGGRLVREHLLERRAQNQLPAIVVGDMNAGPSDPALKSMRFQNDTEVLHDTAHLLGIAGDKRGATHHGFSGRTEGHPIDYILYTDEWKTASFEVWTEKVGNIFPSDHYPIKAVLTLPDAR